MVCTLVDEEFFHFFVEPICRHTTQSVAVTSSGKAYEPKAERIRSMQNIGQTVVIGFLSKRTPIATLAPLSSGESPTPQ